MPHRVESCLLQTANSITSIMSAAHVLSYIRTFHRLHLLRLWTPTILIDLSINENIQSIANPTCQCIRLLTVDLDYNCKGS
jgi:hypothetical protein